MEKVGVLMNYPTASGWGIKKGITFYQFRPKQAV